MIGRQAHFARLYQPNVGYSFRNIHAVQHFQNTARTPPAMLCTIVPIAHYRTSPIPTFLIKIVLVHLIRHDHHPEQKHRPNDIKRKRGLPILTDPLRLQPRQRGLPVRQTLTRPVEIAVAVYGAGGAVKLDGCLDEPG